MKAIATILGSATLALAASRTSPPDGCVHVATSGGDYSSVQEAVDSLSTSDSSDQCIFIDQGTYEEQVYIEARSAALTIYGYSADTTSYSNNKAIITYGLDAGSAGSNDASATLRVWAENTKIYNVNVVNSYGEGSQALALSAEASSGYYGCQFYGFQDTVLANTGQQMYSGCLITGATDFIFGQEAQAWFEGCDIAVRNGGYYITANGRDSDDNPSYYLFNNCNIDAGSGESVSSGTFYLGRPWRTYARVVFQNSELSSVINSAGWSEWNGDDDVSNIYYAEYGNSGSGADGDRVDWATTLSSAVDMSTVLGSTDGAWYDSSYPS